ncbi:Poly(A) polymerase [Terfezia boudieri ATCC MYA-4762]|uniref:Poly(A) polymerase n=1 Tax=Terfezia boudieri ATCC MYA-4762 TaxID=1051890 RepID=A0A3N4M2K8_9PEZI|nr:Poly(A) polymerase [Terfezia boudieri ATCC MYA-4762]
MYDSAPKQWGVTPPISIVGPTDTENAVNQALVEELKRQNSFESPEESQKRIAVLNQLQKVTEEFVRQVCAAKGLPDGVIKSSGGKIFTFGSYRLGVYGPGSDIDTLLLCPSPIHRPDFFQYLPPILQTYAQVTELTPVLDAFVPIIKFKFSGISIDLIFARLNLQSVPRDLTLEDKNLLRGSDEVNLRCLNGTRVTDEILQLVPRVGVFRGALRGIKLWAQRRAIYANVVGFPGGVAWAMLVARICQLYPQAVSAVVISKFFRILGQWSWPTPVLLKGIEDGPLNVKVWNPKIYASDRHHLMPIITPAYPSMCATHNITKSTKEIIMREMKRAAEIMDKIMIGEEEWSVLFKKHEFFTKGYKYYLAIVAASKDAEGQLLWSGMVESKLRLLVMNLEKLDTIALAHPFNKGFDKVHYCHTDNEAEAIAKGGCLGKNLEGVKSMPADLGKKDAAGNSPPREGNGESEQGPMKVWTTTHYVGIEVHPNITKRLDISWPVHEFYDLCRNWQSYDEDMHSIHIDLVRSFELPDDVFSEGEVKPTKTLKKKKAGPKKRGASEAGIDEVRILPKTSILDVTGCRARGRLPLGWCDNEDTPRVAARPRRDK